MTDKLVNAKAALSRLSGCDLSHLTLIEARVVQALRNQGYTEEDFLRLFILLTQDGETAAALRRLLDDVKI